MLISLPRRHRRRVPPGTPIAAEFGPHQLGVRLGDRTDLLSTMAIKRVRRRGATYCVTSSNRLSTIVIPAELVPEGIARELLAR